MRLLFGPDEQQAFGAARDDLVDRFEKQHPELAWLAGLLLDFKWSHLDGDLGSWHENHLTELLLGLIPAKVNLDEDDIDDVIPATTALMRFLAAEGLLAGGHQAAQRLAAHAAGLEDDFVSAAADEERWSFGKRLWTTAAAEGLDFEDPDALQAWIADFNARPREERDAVLGPLPSPAPDVELPPKSLLPDAELAELAAGSIWVRRMAAFVEFVGDGRPLTAKGNLKLADGEALIGLLETSDEFDVVIDDHRYTTKSTRELAEVDLTYRLAAAGDFVETAGGKVRPGDHAGLPAADPLEAIYRIWRALPEIGPTRQHYYRDTYGLGWYADDLDESLIPLHLTLYQHGHRMPIDDFADHVWAELQDRFDLSSVAGHIVDLYATFVEQGLRNALRRLEELGVVALLDVESGDDGDEAGGTVELTPLGTWAVQRYASSFTAAPVVGALQDATAGGLLAAVPDLAEPVAAAEIDGWAASHGDDAAVLLVDALPDAPEAARRQAFGALHRIGAPAIDAVARLTGHPDLGPYATVWQIDAHAAPPASADCGSDPARFVATVDAALDMDSPAGPAHWADLAAGAAGLPDMLDRTWRVDSPATAAVLAAIGDHHPNKAVAKAARRALFKHRSSRGGA